MTNNTRKKAIIIGSGVAGLATAIRLSVQGFEVTVFEKNSEPGGKLTAFNENGFHFDKGPSLFTQPQNLEEIFALAGEKLSDHFQYKSCEIHCNYFYETGERIRAYSDPEKFAAELQSNFGESTDQVKKYLSASKKLYNSIATVFLNHSLHKWNTWLHKRFFKAFSALKLSYLTKSLHAYNAGFFTNKKTVQLFDRYATYNGSNPYKAPAMLSVIPHLEYNEGGFYAEGGMIEITNALYALALRCKVDFRFDTEVNTIIVVDDKAVGVLVNNENVDADVIVSDADVFYVYKNLLNDPYQAGQILQQERSSSALIFYWGINQSFPELGLHNIFFSEDYKKEFEHIFSIKQLYKDPTVYINITSKENPTHAPQGCENWFVMINVPADKELDWTSLAEKAKKNILTKLRRNFGTNIEELIVSETILTPENIDQQTGSYLGSLYGTSSNSVMSAFLRHPNFSRRISNLYFCGGSVHPGGGIPLCLKSAAIVADLIKKKN